MRFGTGIFLTDDTPPPGEVGRIVEERGFESIFVTEYTHRERDLSERVAELRRRAEEAGRPRPDVTYFGVAAAVARRFRG